MACGFERPSPKAVFNRARDMLSVEVLGGSPVIPESNEWYVATLNAAMVDELHSVIGRAWDEADPRRACCDNLIKLAAMDGIYPDPGRGAVGYAEIKGKPGARLPASFRVLIGETEFTTLSTLPRKLPASGTFTTRIQSIRIGADTNNRGGADLIGTLSSEIADVDRAVTIKGGSFCNGSDAETCEQFRERYLARRAYRPRSRTVDVEERILAWPCVTRVCRRAGSCCSTTTATPAPCSNTVNYYAFFDDTFEGGIAPACVIAELNTWLFGETPGHGEGQVDIGICGQIHAMTAVPMTVRLHGLACYSASQRAEVQTRMGEVFGSLCPSSTLPIGALQAAVYQVLGSAARFEVAVSIDDAADLAKVTIQTDGDLDLSCDHVATLSAVVFTDSDSEGSC